MAIETMSRGPDGCVLDEAAHNDALALVEGSAGAEGPYDFEQIVW